MRLKIAIIGLIQLKPNEVENCHEKIQLISFDERINRLAGLIEPTLSLLFEL
jgi:hypothetical protein